jgi:hypothetical protein
MKILALLLVLPALACQAELEFTLDDIIPPQAGGSSCVEGERLCYEDGSTIYECVSGRMVLATSCPTLGCYQDGMDATCNAPASIALSDLCPSHTEPFCEEVTGTIWQCEDVYVTPVELCSAGCAEMSTRCN